MRRGISFPRRTHSRTLLKKDAIQIASKKKTTGNVFELFNIASFSKHVGVLRLLRGSSSSNEFVALRFELPPPPLLRKRVSLLVCLSVRLRENEPRHFKVGEKDVKRKFEN